MSEAAKDLDALVELLADSGFHLEGRAPDGELLESMRAHGWVAAFPAILDAEGNLIAGHRRMAAAKQLGIEPVTQRLPADTPLVEKVRLGLLSNIGGKQFTQGQRRTIAKHLYGQQGWTMVKIAEALRVSTATVSHDLAGFSPTKKPPRPKGGRPRRKQERPKPKPPKQSEAKKQRKGAFLAELTAATEAKPEPAKPTDCKKPGHDKIWRVVGPWRCAICHPPARDDVEWAVREGDER